MTFVPGEIIPYIDMCREEGSSLQRGMNFRLRPTHSVVLMSRRPNAPYADQVLDDGRVILYEGHAVRRSLATPDPKRVDQPMHDGKRLSQTGCSTRRRAQRATN